MTGLAETTLRTLEALFWFSDIELDISWLWINYGRVCFRFWISWKIFDEPCQTLRFRIHSSGRDSPSSRRTNGREELIILPLVGKILPILWDLLRNNP